MSALSIGLILVVVPLVLRWLSVGSARAGTPGTLAYGTKHRTFAVVLGVAPIVLVGALAFAHPPKGADIGAMLGIIGLFVLIATPLLLEFYRVHFTFDDVGITVNSPWSRLRTLRWADVRVVRWRSGAKWLDLADGAGAVRVHLSPWLTGLDHFATLAARSLPTEGVTQDRDAEAVLALMQRGRAGELVWANLAPSVLIQK